MNSKAFIVAIDFDDTLCLGGYPDIEQGVLIKSTVERMRNQVRRFPNTIFILWTCRAKEKLEDAKRFLIKNGVTNINLFNEHYEPQSKMYAHLGTSPKIYADEYWDDKAVRIELTEEDL